MATKQTKTTKKKIYDIIIIGAGPAGMTAAIYAGRSDKLVALIDKDGFGGNIAKSPRVENIPGFVSISGAAFAASMFEQITNLPTVEHFINKAIYLDYRYGLFRVFLDDKKTICGKSVIFATGTTHKELNFNTKDIYYCATCDGPFFKNKNVIVVGSGNTGATYALELATYCKEVYLCDVTMEMCCESVLQKRVLETPNIHWIANTTIKSVNTTSTDKLKSIMLTTLTELECSAIFVAIGLIPETTVVGPFAQLDKQGYIISTDCSTNKIPGIFTAGDCRTSEIKQVVTATSDGATAAIKAINFVNNLNKKE